MRRIPLILLSVASALSLGGCSGKAVHKTDGAEVSAWKSASIDITYMLGHTHRRILMEAQSVPGTPEVQIQAQSFLDGKPLKQGKLDPARYQEYLAKTSDFLERQRKLASAESSTESSDCWAPYTIVYKNVKEIKRISGCRMRDEGAFSHLVKDGEFLIYSQK